MKTYIKFLINLFNVSFFKIFFIFFALILITNIFEQMEFFKDIDLNFFYLVFLSFLNSPPILFEILPFVFLLSTQVFFIYLIDKKELQIFKYSGLNNLTIIKIISLYSFVVGFIFVVVFYNASAVLKNSYLLIKNKYTDDNKYLAVITENGLWIKDKLDNNINIINASKVDNQFLLDVNITQFNNEFEILRIIQSNKVDISSKTWKLFNSSILMDGQNELFDQIELKSNFDLKKINTLFSNLSSLTVPELLDLRQSYIILNYSIIDINSHLYKIATYPIYLSLITILSAIVMLHIGYEKKSFFKIILGILLSVVIYYINYFLNVLGTNEKIPLILSIFLPLIILSIINFTFIIKLNEK